MAGERETDCIAATRRLAATQESVQRAPALALANLEINVITSQFRHTEAELVTSSISRRCQRTLALAHPKGHMPRCFALNYIPQRSAAVCTGASHHDASSSLSSVTVMEHPAMSSDVT